jgi:uncharacterized membrane protein
MDQSEALSALAAKRQAEAQIAKAATCPPWRHTLFGLLMGGLIATPAFAFPLRMAILVVILCCIPVIIQSDRKRLGMFINGYRRGKTRIVAIGMLLVELGVYSISVYYGLGLNDHVMPLLLGLVGVLIGIAGSLLWQRVFVREMGA